MSHKETILYSLKMIDNLVRKLMDRHITADKQGLTIMHTWIVGFLYNNPDRAVYQRDIEREFRVNRATVSGMISLMEQKGLIPPAECIPRCTAQKAGAYPVGSGTA